MLLSPSQDGNLAYNTFYTQPASLLLLLRLPVSEGEGGVVVAVFVAETLERASLQTLASLKVARVRVRDSRLLEQLIQEASTRPRFHFLIFSYYQ